MCQIAKLKMGFRHCDSQAVAVYIMHRGRKIGLCEKCWGKVAKSPLEWGR